MPADGSARLRPGRVEPREIAELRSLKVRHPELASAVDMQIELAELQRPRPQQAQDPTPSTSESEVAARMARGERLVDFDDLLIDWSDFRLVFRQTGRHPPSSRGDRHVRSDALQELARNGDRVEPLARDYYAAHGTSDRLHAAARLRARNDRRGAGLALKPFLARCAEVWGPRVPMKDWRRGWCPLCGLYPDFATIVRRRPLADLWTMHGALAA